MGVFKKAERCHNMRKMFRLINHINMGVFKKAERCHNMRKMFLKWGPWNKA